MAERSICPLHPLLYHSFLIIEHHVPSLLRQKPSWSSLISLLLFKKYEFWGTTCYKEVAAKKTGVKNWCQAKDLCDNFVTCSRWNGITVIIRRKIPFSIPWHCCVLYICLKVLCIIRGNLTLTTPALITVLLDNRREMLKPISTDHKP